MENIMNEKWLADMFDSLDEADKTNYAFVSIKIKQYRHITRKCGRAETEQLTREVYKAICEWAGDSGFAAHLYLGCCNVLLQIGSEASKEVIIRRFDMLEECIEAACRDRFSGCIGSIHCGYGVYLLRAKDDFLTAQYKADICRSQSADQSQMVSHLEIYGISYFEENTELNLSIQRALENKELQMFLQPKVDLKTGSVVEAEALIRWEEPGKGYKSVTSFLPALEEAGMTNIIDFFIFGQACRSIEHWIKTYHKKIKVSVNFSQRSFNYPFFLKEFTDIFEAYDCPKECLEFELLESIVMNQAQRVKEVVQEIRDYGFSCSLDDFGSGYSSYHILTNTELSAIKLDRSLFQDENNSREKLVIRHIIETAHELGMKTVAEGVETNGYVDFLRELGCDYIQGYVFFKPMPAEEFERLFVAGEESIRF